MKKNCIYLFLIIVVFIGIGFSVGGCLKTYQDFRLNANLSGSVAFTIKYDLESLLDIMASIQGGSDADPEMTKMLKETLRQQVEEKMQLPQKKDIKQRLPEGITLEELKLTEKDSAREIFIKFGFSHINVLHKFKDVKLFKNIPKDVGGVPIPVKDPLQQLKDLKIEKAGDILTISQQVTSIEFLQNKESLEAIPSSDQLVPKMIKSMGFFFKIKIPGGYEILEHTAPKYDKEKMTLYWPYPSEKIEKMVQSSEPPARIYVKLKQKSTAKKEEE